MLPDESTWRIRTRRPFPFEFRAFCVFDQARGHYVVTTIVRGDSKVARQQKRRAARGGDSPLRPEAGEMPEGGCDEGLRC